MRVDIIIKSWRGLTEDHGQYTQETIVSVGQTCGWMIGQLFLHSLSFPGCHCITVSSAFAFASSAPLKIGFWDSMAVFNLLLLNLGGAGFGLL
ncbi:unnamed protein product [Cuscuta campestris]|uniref:Uncharacterized protein n=1 Tax=Cuscuta campestris TaxID=132261 RepID=A0A484KW30_9ASTE|nr:unnamed protein product [Cuscuta campestris]